MGSKRTTRHSTLHEYYRQQDVLPTHGAFESERDLDAHERQRRRLFTDKLYLPPRVFSNARLLEFGPDSGENSLVFARWGADCTLVEPNPNAHSSIRKYFKRYNLSDKLKGLECSDIAEYAQRSGPHQKYDFIDAEGFIYTVKPDSLWINLFARHLVDDGFVVLFYYEAFGSFLELFSKVIYSRVRQLSGMNSVGAAHKLFASKWKSIPHKRAIESWVMDVLENPFVRLAYFYEPQSLCRSMNEAGFSLYSSWPPYKDGLDIHWYKKVPTADEQLENQSRFVAHSRLSHMFGRSMFLLRNGAESEAVLRDLLAATDAMLDNFDEHQVNRSVGCLDFLASIIGSDAVFAEAEDKAGVLASIRSVKKILGLLAEGTIPDLVTFCNGDEAFISSWGVPSHFAVFGLDRRHTAQGTKLCEG